MKTKTTNLFLAVRGLIFVPMLILTLFLLYAVNLHSADYQNKEVTMQQDKITVIGKVLDTNNYEIEGVLVKDKNSDLETKTDAEGKFTLSLNDTSTIYFIKIGFQPLEREIAESDSNLVAIMIPESNEMVVRGFATELQNNKDTKWILDSLSSIIDNYPLYIIDDIRMERYFDIKMVNPDNVLSVEVLEDSISKRMYGEGGERGAVKITTKSNNLIDMKNDTPMQLNKTDTVLTTLKNKYEIYKDTMNARNKRMMDIRMKGRRSESVFKGNLEKKDPMDTTTFKIKKNNNMELKIDTTKVLAE